LEWEGRDWREKLRDPGLKFIVTVGGKVVEADIFVDVECGEVSAPTGRLVFKTEVVKVAAMSVLVIEVKEGDEGNDVIWPEDGFGREVIEFGDQAALFEKERHYLLDKISSNFEVTNLNLSLIRYASAGISESGAYIFAPH